MSVVPVTPRTLRPYQCEAVDAVTEAWAEGFKRVGIVLPTGAGKSTVIAALAVTAYRLNLRVVMLAHRGELLNQMIESVVAVDPSLADRVGIVRAEQDDHHQPIVAATLQTLTSAKRREAMGPREVILWDEVHHIGAEGWHNVLVELGGYEGAFMCGFTATMIREDGVRLGDSIEKVVYEKNLRWAIDEGFLTMPRGLVVRLDDLDLNGVTTRAGDFAAGELAEVMEASTGSVVHAISTHARDRRSIVFAAGVEAAHTLADQLTRVGIDAEAVTGQMQLDTRSGVYDRFRSGQTSALVTVQVLTEGADFPMCDAVVIARPTKSKVLYSQMVGRALRLYPGKTDALVLDLVGSTRTMSLVTMTDLESGGETKTVILDGDQFIEVDELQEPEEPKIKLKREGPLELESIDLLGAAHTDDLWLETTGGTPFLPMKNQFVFLWKTEEEGAYRAGWMTENGPKSGEWIQDEATSLTDAAAAGSAWAESMGNLPSRSSAWRRSQAPSDAQCNFARMMGIKDPELKTKARLSDDISVHLISKRMGR